jgi:hypothetical protein
MLRSLASALALFAGASVAAAVAPKPVEAWDCWHSASGSKDDAIAIRLVRADGVITIRGAEFIEYAILEDNEVGIVAVRSYADQGDTTKHLGADVVVIDKKTLEFRKTNVFAKGASADNTPRYGKCAVRR